MEVGVNEALIASIEELTAQNAKFRDNFKQLKSSYEKLQQENRILQKKASDFEAQLIQEREKYNLEKENLRTELDRRISDALAIRDLVMEPADLTSAKEAAIKEVRDTFLAKLAAVADEAAKSQAELQKIQTSTNEELTKSKMLIINQNTTIERLKSSLSNEQSLRKSAEDRVKKLEETIEGLQRELVTNTVISSISQQE